MPWIRGSVTYQANCSDGEGQAEDKISQRLDSGPRALSCVGRADCFRVEDSLPLSIAEKLNPLNLLSYFKHLASMIREGLADPPARKIEVYPTASFQLS